MKRFFKILKKKISPSSGKQRSSKAKKKKDFFQPLLMIAKKITYRVMNVLSDVVAEIWALRKLRKIKDTEKVDTPTSDASEEDNPLPPDQRRRRISLKKYFLISVIFIGISGAGASYVFWHFFVRSTEVVDAQRIQHLNAGKAELAEDRQDYKDVISIDLVKPVTSSPFLATINPDYYRAQRVFADPQIFIIVKNVGLNSELLEDCFDLNSKEVTIALNPYIPNLSDVIEEFQNEGYTVLVSLPLQGARVNEDQGPLTMTTNQAGANDHRLGKLLSMMDDFNGIILERGEVFLKDKDAVRGLQLALSRLKKLIVAPPDVLNNQWHFLASQIGLPTLSTLVEDPVPEDLEAIRQFAQVTGYAIISFDLAKYDDLSTINQWINNAIEAKLVPSSLSKIMINS